MAACPDEADEFFAYMTHGGGDLAGPRRRPADHVRHRRRARPDRAGASPPGRLAGQRARCGSATGPGTSASSTSTASCSARRAASRDQLGDLDAGHPGASWSRRRHRRRAAGRTRTRASGRSAASRSTSCTPSSCAGWRWTAPSRWPACSAPRTGSTGWKRTRDEIRDASCSDGLERAGRRLHPVLRLRRPRRVQPDDADRRVPARRRPAHARHHRRDRGAAHRRARPGLPLPHRAASTGWRARRARSCSARSGWPRRWRWPARPSGPGRVFERAVAYRQRRRPAGRGGRPGDRRAARQLPAGVQPHRSGQRRLGHLRGRAPAGGQPRRLTGPVPAFPPVWWWGFRHDPAAVSPACQGSCVSRSTGSPPPSATGRRATSHSCC